ncbi:MAG: hypothetical protein LBB41_04260 [Prevotellaceae bacterium]|jgi:CRISPR/Cas system Type II protein with McrA/HNH and RuvC-like nuclease domain|nr:hypothetical protein [Prevotellaceae bacterium]
MAKRILGIDLGTNSIGWALVEPDFDNKEGKILGMGSRIIPMGSDKIDYEKGAGITKNADRRDKRTARKGIKRYKLRRNKLLFILNKLGMLPDQFKFKDGIPEPTKLQDLELLPIKKGTLQPDSLAFCQIKVDALSKKVELKDFGKILYNFNQLRGYSGGNNNDEKKKKKKKEKDENEEETKKKYEVIVQKVEIKKVEKSEETFTVRGGKNKGEKLNKFDVTIVLDEEEVEGQTELQNLEEKVGQTEELEVRIKRTKTGETVTFALPQKSNWRKNMEAAEKILKDDSGGIKEKGLFISELKLRDLLQNKWTRVRNRVFLRSRYKEEFDKVWETQANAHGILKNCPRETLEQIAKYIFPGESESQRKLRQEAIEKGLKHIIKEQVVFYQRPLKPQTELISNCRFEKDEKTIATSHPLFQEFRCWKQINNLYITSKVELTPIGTNLFGEPVYGKSKKSKYQYQNRYLTNEEKLALYEKLQTQKEVGFGTVIDVLNLNKLKTRKLDKEQKDYFLNGLNVKAKLKGCDTLISIKKILGDNFDKFLNQEKDIVTKIWDVLYDIKNHDGSEYEPTSKRVLSIIELLQNYTDKEMSTDLALLLAQNIKLPRKYTSLSTKAIHNILPLMQPNPQNISETIKTKFENIKHLIDTGEIIDSIDYNLEDYVIDFVQKNPDILAQGGIMESFAISLVYGKHTAETVKAQITNYHDIKYEERNLRNPVVEQLANEAMQVIKAIWKQYKFNPNELEIRVELARDLKNSAQERDKIWKGQIKSKKINETIKQRLIELKQKPSSKNIDLYKLWSKQNKDEYPKQSKEPTKEEIQKLRLWEEQSCISPYTGKPIPLSKLFSPDRLYDIDHIIPKSRYFDDSMSNKVVCETNVNEEKGNRTAWEYISQQNSQLGILDTDQYLQYINKNFFGKKKKNLLAEKIPSNPVERQLKETQYISVAVKNELAKVVGSENVKTSTGEVTDFLRSRWGLKKLFMKLTEGRFKQMELWDLDENGNPKTEWVKHYVDENNKNQYEIKNWSKRYDHRHHAIDALIVALTEQSHIQRLNNLNKYVQDELIKRKEEFKIEQKEDETILDAFFNLEANRRDEILRTMESSRKFEPPFDGFIAQVREHLETMIVSHKPKDKLGIKVDEKTQKKQLKIRGALHEETYYGKQNGRDKKTIDISKLSAKDISKVIDDVLKKEIDEHRKKYESMKEAFSGEGLKAFNENRFYIDKKTKESKLKPPVYKLKVWYNNKEEKGSTLQRLYDNNPNQSVVTGDNYLFLVMETHNSISNKKERIFDIVSLYDSVAIAKDAIKKDKTNLKQEIVDVKIHTIRNEIVTNLQKKINDTVKEKNKKQKLEQENQDWLNDNITMKPLFTLQQNELIYLPTDENDTILNLSKSKFEEWISNKENKKAFCKRIYKVVKFSGKDCFFIPNTYANVITVAKDLNKEEFEKLKKQNEGKKKIPKTDLNYVEFGSYGNCSPYEANEEFIKNITNNKKQLAKIQDTCIKIQIDWLGNITFANQ